MYAVNLANFLMFPVSGENTVKCWRVFRGNPIVFSSAQITHELWSRTLRGCSCGLFFPPMRNSILLGSLGKTGYQSRARSPRSFTKSKDHGGDRGVEWILLPQKYTVWYEFFAGVYFSGLAVFCVLRELIFAIRTDWFFLLEINFSSFQKVPSTQHW